MKIGAVTVVGAGTMGSGIAHVFSVGGFRVTLVDVEESALERAELSIERNLERQVKKGSLGESAVGEALSRISTSTHLADAAAGSDLVVEAVTEKKEVKGHVLRTADEAAPPHTILASNTSSISLTYLGAQTSRPQRVIGMHFFNPVPVMKLVEIVRGIETSDSTYAAVRDLAEALGKTPVAVKDSPGFVSNRVLMPMVNEAAYCVLEGVAEPQAVDEVMKLGMAHPMGPLALADLIGVDVCLSIMEVLHRELGDDKYRPCPLLRKMVDAGRLGRKSGRGFFEY